uniref:maleylpyruvate isomerase family mycothiol-dependent enzyme n=1 Tax=uncultured Brevibacterium sp. TaxID=189678 RepID=UPI0025DDC77B
MTNFARSERRSLAALLRTVGPDAPTLCEEWTTRDLAVHIVIRDRRPDALVGNAFPALAGKSQL